MRSVQGANKFFLLQWMKLRTFFHFLPELFQRKISIRQFVRFIARLLYFLKKISKNKFIQVQGQTRMDLYVPFFGTQAFWQAASKFKTFDAKLPSTTVLMSITNACRFNCEHCYQRQDIGKDTDIALLTHAAQELQNMGAAFINIEGGDPFLKYERLKELCASIDNRSEIWINSTGEGVTVERLQELKSISPLRALMFSMHSPEKEKVNEFMKSHKAWEMMEEGIEVCKKAGLIATLNSCLQREAFFDGTFERLMETARKHGIALIQLIHPKPAGGWISGGFQKFTAEDIQMVKQKVQLYNGDRAYKDYPAAYAQVVEEDADLFGCTAGGTDRFYINAKGDLQPCEFLHLSFGNIKEEAFSTLYARMRSHFPSGHRDWLCEKYASAIHEKMLEHNLETLPLSPEHSMEIIAHWDRGEETELYRKTEREI
jgi:MoaA/NifB/PqqE/SkfB family radical SAM enzyme